MITCIFLVAALILYVLKEIYFKCYFATLMPMLEVVVFVYT